MVSDQKEAAPSADAVREALLAELRCSVLRAKLLALDCETAGVALKYRLVTVEQAMELLDVSVIR